jgi:hypothetical protein
MSRIGLVVAAASMLGVALAGCSSMPDWMSSSSSADQLQALNFESDPPGAEVRTIQGQTCITPCALTVPSQEQPVTVSRNGYVPQTVQVTVGPQPDHSFWQNPPPTLVPNPVRVVMQASSPSRPVHRPMRRRAVSSAKTAKSRTAAKTTAAAPSAFPDPQQPAQAASPSSSSPFPPPPQTQQPAVDSAFPPPPSTQ